MYTVLDSYMISCNTHDVRLAAVSMRGQAYMDAMNACILPSLKMNLYINTDNGALSILQKSLIIKILTITLTVITDKKTQVQSY
jgi:hypothetical protein